MERTYNQWISYILLISLFLQGCNGANNNSLIPVEEKKKDNIHIPRINIDPLVDQTLIADKGHAVTVYNHYEDKLYASVEIAGEKNKIFNEVPLKIERGANLANLLHLTPHNQKKHIYVQFTEHKKPTKVVICKEAGLLAGMKRQKEDKGKEKETIVTGEKEQEEKSYCYGIYYKEFNAGETPGIAVNDLDLSFEKKCLFNNLDFSLNIGDKVTIVGENGCGKTTFLRLLSGVEEYPYSGSVNIDGSIGFLPQHFEEINGDNSAIVTLLKALHDTEIDRFLEQPYEPFSTEWMHELNPLGGHKIFRQANLIELATELLKKPFKYLSGGEKTKTMLCALSILGPDIILLDEPTNHLDMQGIEWLENFLKKYDGSVVMVTHDRSLINAVSNRISELSPHTKKFAHFKGGYKNYLEEEAKRRQRLIEERQHQEKELKKLKQKANQAKNKIKGRIIRAGSDRDKLSYNNKEQRAQTGRTKSFNQFSDRLEQLNDNLVDIIPQRSQISFDFDNHPAFSSSLLTLEVSDVAKSYITPLFRNVSFTLNKGDRLIIQGPNGAGKSTLMRIIMNLTQADAGSVTISNNAIVGYLDQEQENLPLDISPVALLKGDPLINASDKKAIKNLCDFGIYTWHDLKSPLKMLSIGCRRKAQLCQIIMRKSSILLLDEPTNHIDFPSLEFIEEALLNLPGIIIAATHDRYFTEKVGTRIINLADFKPAES